MPGCINEIRIDRESIRAVMIEGLLKVANNKRASAALRAKARRLLKKVENSPVNLVDAILGEFLKAIEGIETEGMTNT